MGAIAPVPPCTCGLGRKRSFAPGTEVLTPNGKVAIETLREGDMVVARNEETGQNGLFPVSAVMKGQATDMRWLTLADNTGRTSRLGLTGGHPMFVVGKGWLHADEISAGDRIRNADFQELTVLSVEVDTRPQIVHNLEVADAHTYFAGEFEAWGHNAKSRTSGNNKAAAYGQQKHKEYHRGCGPATLPSGKKVDGLDPVNKIVYELKPDTPAKRRRGKKQLADYLCELGDEWEGILEFYPPFKG